MTDWDQLEFKIPHHAKVPAEMVGVLSVSNVILNHTEFTFDVHTLVKILLLG